jgi:hypothetical protein
MTRRAKQYRPRQFKKFSSSNNVFVAGAKGHQIKISFPCATQREQMNYAVIFRRSVSTFSTLANSFSAIKKTGRTEEARPGNHSGLFYLVAAGFDGLRRPDEVFGEVLLFFAPALVSFFLVNSARTVALTLARSIL